MTLAGMKNSLRYIEGKSIEVLSFTVTLAGLKNSLRCIEGKSRFFPFCNISGAEKFTSLYREFVKWRFVKTRFHCS